MILTLLGTVGLLATMAIVVPLLAYGLSALVDRITRGDDGEDGQGGLLAPRRPGPSGPPAPITRSAEPGKDQDDGTVS